EDASNNPVNPPALQEEARRIGINYTAIFPITHNNEVIGTLGVDIAAENAILNKKQISLLEAALSPISASIERLRAEELLARSETDLRALFASMHDVIIVYDYQGRYVRIAPTNPERLIRPPDELIGKTIYEAVPAELHQPFMEAIQRALGGEQDVRLEYPLRIEEHEYWFEASVSPLNSSEVFWVARDITERKRVEEVLRASEDRFRSILDNIEDGYYEVDTAGNLTFFNPALVRLLGRPANELIGLNNRMFMPASGVKSVFQTYNRVFKTGIPEQAFNWDVMRPDGTLRAVEASVSPIKVADGSIAGFRGTVRDVTDRKKSEETLRRSNEYLSATAEIGQLVTSTLDMPTLFSRTVNLVRDRFRFYHASIFVTEETGFRTILQAATGEAGTEMIRQKHSLQVGSKSIVGEVAESGHAIIVNDTVASETHKFNPLLPETRAETAIPLRVGTRTIGVLDIQSTSPNAFSEDDIAVLQILADQVAIAIDNARSSELSMQAVKEMREADRLKSQFLANMSHELRTPLNSIIGFSRVILKGIDGAITDLQQQDLLAIHNSGQHLLGLINDILDLSRIEAGKMELTFDEVNLPDLITSVISTVGWMVMDKHITLDLNLPANLPSVRADVLRIRQVLINLLSTAAKFTDEGTITVLASVVDNPT
ncbi:MAG TPA: PAS domain S-box protein, partial [Anaerolineales bacterium]|nr:PAS domain S-box protein [Anaerolineales bacterium]